MVVGCRLLIVGSLFDMCCLLLVGLLICCFAVRCLLVVGSWLLVVGCWFVGLVFVVGCVLFVGLLVCWFDGLLCVVCGLMFDVCWFVVC